MTNKICLILIYITVFSPTIQNFETKEECDRKCSLTNMCDLVRYDEKNGFCGLMGEDGKITEMPSETNETTMVITALTSSQEAIIFDLKVRFPGQGGNNPGYGFGNPTTGGNHPSYGFGNPTTVGLIPSTTQLAAGNIRIKTKSFDECRLICNSLSFCTFFMNSVNADKNCVLLVTNAGTQDVVKANSHEECKTICAFLSFCMAFQFHQNGICVITRKGDQGASGSVKGRKTIKVNAKNIAECLQYCKVLSCRAPVYRNNECLLVDVPEDSQISDITSLKNWFLIKAVPVNSLLECEEKCRSIVDCKNYTYHSVHDDNCELEFVISQTPTKRRDIQGKMEKIIYKAVNTDSLIECEKKCESFPECKYFSYHDDYYKNCRLKFVIPKIAYERNIIGKRIKKLIGKTSDLNQSSFL